MNRLSIFRGLRKSTAIDKKDNSPKPLPELPSPEIPDDNSLHRPSSHISRTTAQTRTVARQSFQTAATHVSRHSGAPSISSLGPDPTSPTLIETLPGYNRRISSDPSLRKLQNYLFGSDTALVLAVAFLRATNKQYNKYLRTHQAKAEANQKRNRRMSRATDTRTSLLTVSIEMTLEELKARFDKAFQLLEILAFFEPKNVCYEVFSRTTPLTVVRETVSSRVTFENALAQLQSFGVVEHPNWYYHIQPQIHSWIVMNPALL